MSSKIPKPLAGGAFWLLAALAAVLTVPDLAEWPTSGVDPSWKLGLHMASEQGIAVGRDVFFNYGPWGYLTVPLQWTASTYFPALAFHVVVHFGLFALIGVLMRRHSLRLAWLALVPLIAFEPTLEYQFLFGLLLAVWLSSSMPSASHTGHVVTALAGVALSAAMYVKFSAGVAGLAMVGAAIVALVWVGRLRRAAVLIGAYSVGVLACGWAAIGFGGVAEFFRMSWEISAGYAVAAERHGPLWQPILALLGFMGVAIGVHAAARRRREIVLLALPAVALFVIAFKHAFVRHDTHGSIALIVGLTLAIWIVLETFQAASYRRWAPGVAAAAAAALMAGAAVSEPSIVHKRPSLAVERIGEAWRVAGEVRQPGHSERVRASLREQLPFPAEFRLLVDGETVDVMTLQTAMIAAWDLNWTPRPVLQSYVVTTDALDRADAEFMTSKHAPSRLLVSLQALDTRHPFMDAPLTWRAVLAHYEPVARDRRWVVLARRAQPRQAVAENIGNFLADMNEPIEVPRPERGHLEVRVQVEPTWLGRLIGTTWKRPDVRLGLLSAAGTEPRRLVPATADEPFPIGESWPDYPDQALNVFADNHPPPPRGLELVTQGSWAYKPAKISFYQVTWH